MTADARVGVERLPDSMSCLARLRHLSVQNMRIGDSCGVLKTLTALTNLDFWWSGELPEHRRQSPHCNPLPAGMDGLRSLQVMRVTCYHQPVPRLALQGLQDLQLAAPSIAPEVRRFRRYGSGLLG